MCSSIIFRPAPADDLVKATDTARSMVLRYGMDKELGHVAYERERQPMLGPMAGTGGIHGNSPTTACPCCQGQLHKIGEDVGEVLDVIPAILRVLRTVRPKYACRRCTDGVVQAKVLPRLFADGRGTEEIAGQLTGFSGILQVDGYAAYKALARGHGAAIQLAVCLAHARRTFVEVYKTTQSPFAREVIERLQAVYVIKAEIAAGLKLRRHWGEEYTEAVHHAEDDKSGNEGGQDGKPPRQNLAHVQRCDVGSACRYIPH